MKSLCLQEAEILRDRAIEHAVQIGAAVAVCVVDSGARPIVLSRMDHAPFMMAELAIGKAECAVGMGIPSGALQKAARPSGELYGVNTLLGGRVLLMGGGLPLVDGDKIVGAVGISGGTTAQDEQIAEVVKAAWLEGRGGA